MAKVILKNIEKIYSGGVKAVDDFNLEIKDKEFVVLVGPSGCGKSTTLRMIAGLEEITRGELYIGENLVNDVPPKDRDIAMVFQNYALYPHMTVYENMAFGLKLRKYPKKEIETRVKDAANILGLNDLLQRTPKALSGGQRQRVALGRSIVRKPKVFLFDEPLSNLDAKLRVQMRSEISKLHTRLQATMIYVTHDQTEAMTMGDRIVVMKDGIIQQIAHPIDLYNHPINKFVGGFIGSPPMNFFDVKVTAEDKHIYVSDGKFKIKLAADMKDDAKTLIGKDAVMGIRPEDIYLEDEFSGKIDENLTESIVEVIEPMGAETYLYFSNSVSNFIAKVTTQVKDNKVNETYKLVFDVDRLKLFDKETEKTVVDLNY